MKTLNCVPSETQQVSPAEIGYPTDPRVDLPRVFCGREKDSHILRVHFVAPVSAAQLNHF